MTDQAQFPPVTGLLGTAICDVEGVVVGHVSEFLVDEHEGRIAYIQFSLSSDDSAPRRRITVPWSALTSSNGRGTTWQLRVPVAALRALVSP